MNEPHLYYLFIYIYLSSNGRTLIATLTEVHSRSDIKLQVNYVKSLDFCLEKRKY